MTSSWPEHPRAATPASESSSGTAAAHLAEHSAALEAYLRTVCDRTGSPSLVVLAEAGDERFALALGHADLESGRPPTTDTIYGLGSVSKAYAGLAVLQLVSAGLVRLHDPIEKVLGRVPSALAEATVHHLLTHTSGLPPLDARYLALDRANPDVFSGGSGAEPPSFPSGPVAGRGFTDHNGLLDYLLSLDLNPLGPPGRWFSYSNEGYVLLSGVVAEATGQSYEDYCRTELLGALGLTRTAFIGSAEAAAATDMATPYAATPALRPNAEFRVVEWWDAPAWAAPGGLLASAADLLAFARAVQTGAPGVEDETLAMISAPHVQKVAGAGHYGYGLGVNPGWNGHTIVGHGGGRIGTSAHMSWVVETGATAVAVSNVAGAPVGVATAAVLAASCGIDPAARPTTTPRPKLPDSALDLQRFVGNFTSGEGAAVTFDEVDGHLHLRQRTASARLFPITEDQFVLRSSPSAEPALLVRFLAEGLGPAWGVALGARILTRDERGGRLHWNRPAP